MLRHEPLIRLSFFFGAFLLLALLEWRFPRKALRAPKLLRWSSNLLLIVVDSLLVRLILPFAVVGFAAVIQEKGIGLMNWLALPGFVEIILSIIALDLIIYG